MVIAVGKWVRTTARWMLGVFPRSRFAKALLRPTYLGNGQAIRVLGSSQMGGGVVGGEAWWRETEIGY